MLGYSPTSLYIDNEAALHMINERRPTPRARHIDVQHFAIQEWREHGHIIMQHIPGSLNPSDALTKPLTPALHLRHCLRAMGHHRIQNPLGPAVTLDNDGAGEGVGSDSDHAVSAVADTRPVPDEGRECQHDPAGAKDRERIPPRDDHVQNLRGPTTENPN